MATRKHKITLGSGVAPEPPEEELLFPGDPGEGNYYIAWSLEAGGSVPTEWHINTMRTNPGWPGDDKISMLHDYSNQQGTSTQMLSHNQMIDIMDEGFIVDMSFHYSNFSHTTIAQGGANPGIDGTIQFCLNNPDWVFWFCFTHEPEDNFTTATTQANYRAAYRYICNRFKSAGVTNVGWQPIYMNSWTWDSHTSNNWRDWRRWHADWRGTDTKTAADWYTGVDRTQTMFGMDTYFPTIGSSSVRPFGNTATSGTSGVGVWQTSRFKAAVTNPNVTADSPHMPGGVELPALGVPAEIYQGRYTMPEFGMSNAAPDTFNWVTWAQQMVPYMQTNGIKYVSYWDNSDTVGRYTMDPAYDPNYLSKRNAWLNVIVPPAVKWSPP